MGSANRVRLSSIAEVTKGVTPATPALQTERWLSESLAYNIENVQSEQIRADRTRATSFRLALIHLVTSTSSCPGAPLITTLRRHSAMRGLQAHCPLTHPCSKTVRSNCIAL